MGPKSVAPGEFGTVPADQGTDDAGFGYEKIGFGEMDDSKTRRLIESRMPQRSLAQLERETGLDNLPRRLAQARRQRYVPLDVVGAVTKATGISVAELVVALFDDAGYGDLLPFDLTPEVVATLVKLLQAEPSEQALVSALMDWFRFNADRLRPP